MELFTIMSLTLRRCDMSVAISVNAIILREPSLAKLFVALPYHQKKYRFRSQQLIISTKQTHIFFEWLNLLRAPRSDGHSGIPWTISTLFKSTEFHWIYPGFKVQALLRDPAVQGTYRITQAGDSALKSSASMSQARPDSWDLTALWSNGRLTI